MPQSIGFWYERDGYDTSGKRLLGRQAAGESFLKSLVNHTRAGRLYCVAPSQQQYHDCVKRIQSWQAAKQTAAGRPAREVTFVPADDPHRLGDVGTLYRPDPVLGKLAWLRRFAGQRKYSVCGVTHTICTRETMQQIGNLIVAPMQPWDALICTSRAVRTAVDRMLSDWGEYLASLYGGRPAVNLQLPIIPLGIETTSFAASKESQAMRGGLRKTLEIGPDDVVVLYVGRLVFYAKAHPIPMYFALERAAQQTGKKIHLILAGWFEQEREEKAFKAAAKKFCPSVSCVFLDGRRPELRQQAWAASDVFMSLSDNIQETFGLTPVEAMAAGRPVICSDWDGYQDTVRHEVDGFRVPVICPPPGCGVDFARDFFGDRVAYSKYTGLTCQSTAVDVDAVTKSLVTLVEQPQLRAQMGAAGQARARQVFDWSVVIRQYDDLWDQLADLRARGTEIAAPRSGVPLHPLCDDPFRAFGHYTPRQLGPKTVVALGSCGTIEIMSALVKDEMVSFGGDRRLPPNVYAEILNLLKDSGPQRLETFLTRYSGNQVEVYRTIGWLMKFGVVRVSDS